MPQQHQKLYVLAYDIANKSRLQRVHRVMTDWGIALQYSVWLLPVLPRQLKRLLEELERLIDPQADDVRVYPLPERPHIHQLGCACKMEGVMLLGNRPIEQTITAMLG